jgi:hypothetical protein
MKTRLLGKRIAGCTMYLASQENVAIHHTRLFDKMGYRVSSNIDGPGNGIPELRGLIGRPGDEAGADWATADLSLLTIVCDRLRVMVETEHQS